MPLVNNGRGSSITKATEMAGIRLPIVTPKWFTFLTILEHFSLLCAPSFSELPSVHHPLWPILLWTILCDPSSLTQMNPKSPEVFLQKPQVIFLFSQSIHNPPAPGFLLASSCFFRLPPGLPPLVVKSFSFPLISHSISIRGKTLGKTPKSTWFHISFSPPLQQSGTGGEAGRTVTPSHSQTPKFISKNSKTKPKILIKFHLFFHLQLLIFLLSFWGSILSPSCFLFLVLFF